MSMHIIDRKKDFIFGATQQMTAITIHKYLMIMLIFRPIFFMFACILPEFKRKISVKQIYFRLIKEK